MLAHTCSVSPARRTPKFLTLMMQGEVYALLGSTLQVKMYQTLGSIFNGNLHKERALDIQSNALKQCVDYFRYSLGEILPKNFDIQIPLVLSYVEMFSSRLIM